MAILDHAVDGPLHGRGDLRGGDHSHRRQDRRRPLGFYAISRLQDLSSRQQVGASMKSVPRFAIFGAMAPAVSTVTMFVLAGWAVFLRTHSANAALAWLADSTQLLEPRLA